MERRIVMRSCPMRAAKGQIGQGLMMAGSVLNGSASASLPFLYRHP